MSFRFFALVAAAAVCLCASASVEAGYVITLTSGAETVVLQNSGSGFTAGGSGFDASDFAFQSTSISLGGPRVQFAGTVGNFSLELTISTNYPGQADPVGATISDLALTANNIGTGSSVLDIDVLFNDWSLPGGTGGDITVVNTLATSRVDAGGSITFSSFGDGVSTDPITLATSPAIGQSTATFVRGATFDMGNHATVRLTQGGVASFDASTHAVAPEATTIIAWGLSAVVFIAFFCRQRRKTVLS